ncbi:MAG TPA: hypothetical protein VM187_12015, partial [Niastella sp.]|nr:hypothetical protein [Niastella sp.]
APDPAAPRRGFFRYPFIKGGAVASGKFLLQRGMTQYPSSLHARFILCSALMPGFTVLRLRSVVSIIITFTFWF